MPNNTVVHCGFNNERETNLIKRYADSYGLTYVWQGIKNDTFQSANSIKFANFVVIWNGLQHTALAVSRICSMRGIPKCYIEWGMLSQSDHFFIDPCGFCGDSILNKDLSWINKQDIDKMLEKRSELQSKYPISDEGYILVPLQIENDTQILHHTKYNNMDDFVKDIENMYPNNTIIIKTHPNSTAKRSFDRAIISEERDFMTLASKASVVVGLTSTTLYEAGILGKKIVAIGNHPLRSNNSYDHDRVLAGALVLNIKRDTGNLRSVLERFHIKPILPIVSE